MAYNLEYVYRIIDQYSGPINKMRQSAESFKKSINRTSEKMRGFSERLSSAQSGIAALGGAAGLGYIINTSVRFEESMNRVNAIMLASDEQMGAMRKQAEMLGRTTQFSAVQAADAFTFLGQAGLSVEQSMRALPGTLQLAAAGGLDLAAAADIATNVLSGMQMDVSELGRVNDVLAMAAAKSNTNITQLSSALAKAAPVASATGMSIEQTVAILGKMADAGIRAELAGTALAGGLARLLKPTPEVTKGLRSIGLSLSSLKGEDGKLKPFNKILEMMAERGVDAAAALNIFGQEAGPKIMAVLGQGSDALSELQSKLENSNGSAKKMAETMQKGAPGAIKRFQSAIEGLALLAAKTLLPTFTKVVNTVTDLISRIQESNPQLVKYGVIALAAVTGIAALSVVVGILSGALASLLTVAAVLLGPIGILIGFGVAVAASWDRWVETSHPVIDSFSRIYDGIGRIIEPFAKLVGFTGDAKDGFSGMLWFADKLGTAIEYMLMPLELLVNMLAKLSSFAAPLIGSAISALGEAFGGNESPAQAVATRRENINNKLELSGNVTVSATQGTKVEKANIGLNGGSNMAYAQ